LFAQFKHLRSELAKAGSHIRPKWFEKTVIFSLFNPISSASLTDKPFCATSNIAMTSSHAAIRGAFLEFFWQISLAVFHSSLQPRLPEPTKLPRFSKGGNTGEKLSAGQDNGAGLVSQFQRASPLPSGGGEIIAPRGPIFVGGFCFAYACFCSVSLRVFMLPPMFLVRSKACAN
jgi:hypothetical protein